MLRSWMLLVAALAAINQFALAQPLKDQNFEVVRLYGKPVKYEQSPSLAFGADGRATGRGGCNSYGAEYSTGAKTGRVWTIRFQNISSTRMYCGPASVVEGRFFNALRSARRYQLKDGALTFYGARGRAPLMRLTRVAM